MQNKFGTRISTGGATGAYTMSAAHAYLAAGRFKTALVLGVEKATDCFDFSSMSATPEVIKSIGWSGDSFFEQSIGWSASDSYAEVVLAYMDEHPGDLKPEITAKISSILSEHVKDNPLAQRQHDQVTPDEVMNSRMVVYPFRELEICVYSEGAAALILAEEETALAISKNSGKPVIWLTGLGEANEHSFAGRSQKDMSRIMSDYYGSRRAYEMAGITDPTRFNQRGGASRRVCSSTRNQHGRIRPGPSWTGGLSGGRRADDPGRQVCGQPLRRIDLLRPCCGSQQHHVRVVCQGPTHRRRHRHSAGPRNRKHGGAIHLLHHPGT